MLVFMSSLSHVLIPMCLRMPCVTTPTYNIKSYTASGIQCLSRLSNSLRKLQNKWLCRIEGQVNQVIAIWPEVLPQEKFVYFDVQKKKKKQ